MNKAVLMGRVGKDPETRSTQSGMQVATFSLATSKKIKGEQQTCWHNLVAFDKTAEILTRYVSKGDQLLVMGEINNRSYEDKSGQKKYVSEVIINEFHFIGDKKDSARDERRDTRRQEEPLTLTEDDFPF